jgi:hypothetical protein
MQSFGRKSQRKDSAWTARITLKWIVKKWDDVFQCQAGVITVMKFRFHKNGIC